MPITPPTADLPPDINRWRYTWNRRRADAWTDSITRYAIRNFVEGYVETRSWAQTADVTERFIDNGVNRRQPFGPTEVLATDVRGGDQREQSPGIRIVVVGITRGRDRVRLETAITFHEGNDITPAEMDRLLGHAMRALDAEHRRNPPP